MNRTIKFRVWAKDEPLPDSQGQMLSWGDIYQDHNFFHLLHYQGLYTLMQSTGLFDKNGVEIFEADKIRMKDRTIEDKGVVRYKGSSFVAGKHNAPIDDWDELEVIGNIFENPELIN